MDPIGIRSRTCPGRDLRYTPMKTRPSARAQTAPLPKRSSPVHVSRQAQMREAAALMLRRRDQQSPASCQVDSR